MFFFKIVWVISFFIKIVQGGEGGGGGGGIPLTILKNLAQTSTSVNFIEI